MGASLRAAQLRVLLDLLSELHACADELALRLHLTDRIDRLVPCDLVSLNYIDLAGEQGGTVTSFNGGLIPSRPVMDAFDAFAGQHPLVQAMVRTGRAGPRRMSDYIAWSELRRLDLYREVFAPLETRHQIGFSLSLAPEMVIGIGINRQRSDFSTTELSLIELLHEHLGAAFAHVALKASVPRLDAFGLTARETEVLLLLCRGLDSASIARQLYLSRRTVEKHLENCYGKLGVRNRWAAANLLRRTSGVVGHT